MRPYKKLARCLLIAICASFISNAQKLYLGVDAGYGLTTATKKNFHIYGTSPSENVDVNCLLGKGFSFGVNAGTMLFSRAGIDIGIHYLIGDSTKGSKTYGDSFNEEEESITLEANMLRLVPSIKLMAFSKEKETNFYVKLGMIIGLAGKVNDVEMYKYTHFGTPGHSNTYSSTEEKVYEWNGGISTGFTGTLGLTIKTGNVGCFFTELCFISQTWAPKKRIMTSYIYDGYDMLYNLPESEKQTDFVDSKPVTSTTNQNEPSKELKVYMPLSALYLNIGFQFSFGGKKKAEAKPATEVK